MDKFIYYGNAVKALGNGKVGGYAVRFTSENEPDLDGEFFTKDTFFGAKSELPLFYQHGFDAVLGAEPLKFANVPIMAKNTTEDEIGLWYEAQLDLSNQYQAYLYQMAEDGKIGYSTGAVGYLVQKESKGNAIWIKSWTLGEVSLTPTPAEPKNVVLPAKSMKAISDDMSLSDYVSFITSAWYSQNPDMWSEALETYTFYSYVSEVYQSFIIVVIEENNTRKVYKISYLQNASNVVFGTDRVEVVRVTTYEEINVAMKALKELKSIKKELPIKGDSDTNDGWDNIRQTLDTFQDILG